jgi:two-component system sensor histidine kinase HydH
MAPFTASTSPADLDLLRSVHRERLGEMIARSVAHALRDLAQVVDVIELTEGRGLEGGRAHAIAAGRLREGLLTQIALLEAFALSDRQRITPLAMADVVDTAVQLARRAIGPTPVTLDVRVPRTLPPAVGIAGDMAEAIYAVVVNAIEAVRIVGGGTIQVTGTLDVDAVRIVVQDSGPGLPEMLAEGDRVFEPSLVAGQRVQGIGLPVARELVRRHGGELAIVAHDGPGARFAFRLPLWRRVAASRGRS